MSRRRSCRNRPFGVGKTTKASPLTPLSAFKVLAPLSFDLLCRLVFRPFQVFTWAKSSIVCDVVAKTIRLIWFTIGSLRNIAQLRIWKIFLRELEMQTSALLSWFCVFRSRVATMTWALSMNTEAMDCNEGVEFVKILGYSPLASALVWWFVCNVDYCLDIRFWSSF